MNWIDIIWHSTAGVCLALSGVYFFVWLSRRDQFEHLTLSLVAAAVAAMALMEAMAMQVRTVEEYTVLARWFHVPIAVFFIAIVPFVRLRYRVGSLWLGVAAVGVRLGSLVANFYSDVNVNFSALTALRPSKLLGIDIVYPQGTPNPWMTLASLSLLLLVLFLLHGIWQMRGLAPRHDALHAKAMLLSVAGFVTFGAVWGVMVATGAVSLPFLVVPPFVGVVLALGLDLGLQLLRVPELSRSLEQSEASRRARETELQIAGRLGGVGTWTWRCRDGEISCSQTALALLDLPPCGPLDRARLAASIPPEHRAAILQGYDDASRGDGDFENEFSLTLRDGGERWLSAVGHLERDAQGEALAVHGVLRDITRRREADQRFRRLVEAAPMAILLVEDDGRIAFANAHAEAMFGYPRVELCALSVDDLVPPDRRRGHAALRAGYVFNGSSHAMAAPQDVIALRKDGSEIAVEVNLSVIPSQGGGQVLAMVNDTGPRKLAEQEALSRRNELAHLSRVALLAELSGSLAHELNQPLTAILSNAQAGARFLARDPPDLQEVRESLHNIVESDKRAGEIIRRLRAMLRKDPPDFQRLDLNQVVADVLHIVHSDLIGRNVDVRLALQPDLPATMGDRVQLQQVLLNLIMNGCDAMASCPAPLVLTIRTTQTDADRIRLAVSDVGRGIPEDDLERIFLPFVSSKSAGLGLGLAVCKTIVHAHDGRLWAGNNAGPGATLHLELNAEGAGVA